MRVDGAVVQPAVRAIAEQVRAERDVALGRDGRESSRRRDEQAAVFGECHRPSGLTQFDGGDVDDAPTLETAGQHAALPDVDPANESGAVIPHDALSQFEGGLGRRAARICHDFGC